MKHSINLELLSVDLPYTYTCFVYPASLSCVSHSIDICTVAIKNIRNVHAVSTNQIVDILHFNDKLSEDVRVSYNLVEENQVIATEVHLYTP